MIWNYNDASKYVNQILRKYSLEIGMMQSKMPQAKTSIRKTFNGFKQTRLI